MKKHNHTEAELNEYLNAAMNIHEEFDSAPHYKYAEQAVSISRTLGISLDDSEFLMDTYDVYIPKYKDRDMAIMVLEMNLTFEQAKHLYEAGFQVSDLPQPATDPFSLPNSDEFEETGTFIDNGYYDIEEEVTQPF